MVLINCRQCGHEMFSKAEHCPHCGAPAAESQVTTNEADDAERRAKSRPKRKKARKPKKSGCLLRVTVAMLLLAAAGTCAWAVLGGKSAQPVVVPERRGAMKKRTEKVTVPPKQARLVPVVMKKNGDLRVEVTVVNGGALNLYVINDREYHRFMSAYENIIGNDFLHYEAFHAADIERLTRQGRLQAGSYWVIVENPALGLLQDELLTATISLTR